MDLLLAVGALKKLIVKVLEILSSKSGAAFDDDLNVTVAVAVIGAAGFVSSGPRYEPTALKIVADN